VHYRELEGHESPLFLSYFKSTGAVRVGISGLGLGLGLGLHES
jgi:hypothetical protein